ncbi:hypothetical protein [Streptomyces sp. NPDC088789]|uniref:hypothetical protein n=1 Tax=Streptomyces sp. NPDC088789 TaxID=3365899 RepID=UPI0037F8D349
MTNPIPDPLRYARDIARHIDRLAEHLIQAPPPLAAQIISEVLDPEEGILGRFTTLMATGSHFAKSHAEHGLLPPEVWLALGRAANELHDIGLDLDEHADTLRALAQAKPPGTLPAAPAASPLVVRKHR